MFARINLYVVVSSIALVTSCTDPGGNSPTTETSFGSSSSSGGAVPTTGGTDSTGASSSGGVLTGELTSTSTGEVTTGCVSGCETTEGSVGTSSTGPDTPVPDAPPSCVNLECDIPACPPGQTTKLTGIVHAPTLPQYGAADPLFNVAVYIPNAPLEPQTEGVTCSQCGGTLSGDPLVVTSTDAKGAFELADVPAGVDIPLVVQIGKWRRQVVIPEVPACETTALPDELTRLPRNQQEGSIPRIAVASSPYDAEECILRKIGVDDGEFTAGGGAGRIHIYDGGGATIAGAMPAEQLWGNLDLLKQYDMVLFPCSAVASNDPAAMQNVHDYADAGGRVFATDLSYPWYTEGPADFQGTAQWIDWTGVGVDPLPATIDQGFPKGQALAEWLLNIGATPMLGSIDLHETYNVVDAVNEPTTRWLYSTNPATVQTLSFNTPVGAPEDQQCGRAVYSNFHIANGFGQGTFPGECTPDPLTPQEKVLEFMLFDLASCLQPDTEDPRPG